MIGSNTVLYGKKKPHFWPDFWDPLFFRSRSGGFLGVLGGDFWRIFGGVLHIFNTVLEGSKGISRGFFLDSFFLDSFLYSFFLDSLFFHTI